tara:strand:- start:1066 stop:1848 length:783 start_codon:yes stop_codon:yes gene_type:complete
MKGAFGIILLLFLFLTACSQKNTADIRNGLLWRIESKNGTESYIFGTIHLYPKSELILSDTVIAKLQNCNTLALERDITNEAEQRKYENFQMPELLLESYRAIVSEYGDSLENMEGQLIQKAQESKIKITGLESIDEILNTMKTLSTIKVPENAFIKREILSNYQKSLKMYKEESIGQFKDSITIQIGETITSILVDERNENWLNDIESLIEKDRSFIAVGMGHLGGKEGVINLLRKKGYKLEPIRIDNTPPNISSYKKP